MENEKEMDLDAELASLRKAADEHEQMLQNARGFMKTAIDLGEQQQKLNLRLIDRLDKLERRHNELAEIVSGLALESRGP